MKALANRMAAVREAGRLIVRRPFRFGFAVIFSTAVSTLLVLLCSFVWSMEAISERLASGAEANVFIAQGTSSRDIETIKAQLQSRADVVRVDWVTREAALQSLSERSGSAHLADLKSNPLPDVLVVRFDAELSPAALDAAIGAIGNLGRVDAVASDLQWHRNFSTLVTAGTWSAVMLASLTLGALALGVLGAVQLQMAASQREVQLLVLIGAETRFITRPYGYLAASALMLGGLLGVAFGIALVDLAQPVNVALERLTVGWLQLAQPPITLLGALPVIAGLVGWGVGNLAARKAVY